MKTGGLFMLAVRLMQLHSENDSDFRPLLDALGLYFQIRDDYANLKVRLAPYAQGVSHTSQAPAQPHSHRQRRHHYHHHGRSRSHSCNQNISTTTSAAAATTTTIICKDCIYNINDLNANNSLQTITKSNCNSSQASVILIATTAAVIVSCHIQLSLAPTMM